MSINKRDFSTVHLNLNSSKGTSLFCCSAFHVGMYTCMTKTLKAPPF